MCGPSSIALEYNEHWVLEPYKCCVIEFGFYDWLSILNFWVLDWSKVRTAVCFSCKSGHDYIIPKSEVTRIPSSMCHIANKLLWQRCFAEITGFRIQLQNCVVHFYATMTTAHVWQQFNYTIRSTVCKCIFVSHYASETLYLRWSSRSTYVPTRSDWTNKDIINTLAKTHMQALVDQMCVGHNNRNKLSGNALAYVYNKYP